MAAPMWTPGSWLDNLNAFADGLGYQNADIAMGMAGIPWENDADRSAFINHLTATPYSELVPPTTPPPVDSSNGFPGTSNGGYPAFTPDAMPAISPTPSFKGDNMTNVAGYASDVVNA